MANNLIKIQIKHYFTGAILFEFEKENNTLKDTVVEANLHEANLREANLYEANLYEANLRGADLRGANLRGANLRRADLHGANLRGANLREANLREANLYEANLYGADLREANLRGANLRGANLRRANLYEADLRGADLYEADLRGADLRGADLHGANLYGADLHGANLYGADLEKLPTDYINSCSRDMLFIFQCLKGELPFLRDKLVKGEVDGTQYEGDCACLIGTLANADGGLDEVCRTIPFYERGTHNPAEAWFLNIHIGDTPKDNQFAAHALKLVDMVLDEGKKKKK